ncbi:Eco57I restriction-modification methylase domain-containing protein [Vibrio parahaemolyticus]|uniref:Eco57I restriction-modification methylase domain-containing protein n=1 Tax=Vibrio parahaemolyticus TaxID=670 RepID=UPI0004DFC549|nr:N-6 DNA methylase [Vibrio parahaemolyticus]MCZ6288737.1 N-6 DNA methylase [Vibrio parahaemolyticus]HBH7855191.1 N-6 DNA methylase [Vibrio parahaemolyticus]HCD5149937.1 N-6 DNA methylase [Vibrio parahaemolyticus]HCD5187161.1 N-6 DNA methylase [Vibrio parahaemolyticus]
MEAVENRYQHVTCRKSEGAHYTPTRLSQFVSEKILTKLKKRERLVVADPAIGDGELILSLLNSLDSTDNVEVIGFDINLDSIELSKQRIYNFFPNVKINLIHGDFLDYCINNNSENCNYILPKFDVIIANPPYVRTQVLGAEQSKFLSQNFGLKGRVDIYQAFLIGMSKCLSEDGVAGVIVSNRFLTTKGTGALRQSLYDLYDIYNIWDFGDTKLFEAAVLPAVLLFSLRKNNVETPTNFCSIYETNDEAKSFSETPVDAISLNGVVKCSNGKSYIVKSGQLDYDSSPKDIWRIKDLESQKWLSDVASKTWATFGEVGKIRVGVKTTADNVFIKESWIEEVGVEPELLKPLITHHVAGRFQQSDKKTKQILYTHETVNGKKKAVDIENYPVSHSYLEQHREQLEGRKYVIDANRNWFEIWVPQNPQLWLEDKIVFRDICEEPTFWLDKDQSIVNGDCYWMLNDFRKDEIDILWLILAVANSKFIELFYDTKFNNKLYSNKRRFISQYVEQFPLPDPKLTISLKMIDLAKSIFSEGDIRKRAEREKILNNLVWEAFDLPQPKD